MHYGELLAMAERELFRGWRAVKIINAIDIVRCLGGVGVELLDSLINPSS